MWKLAAALLLGSTFLFGQGCCWPMYEGHHRHPAGWDERGRYERAPVPPPWAPGRE